MRLKFVLVALLVSISILLMHSNSFSTAELRNDLVLSVVEENEALIAITEWEGRVFRVLNNTGNTVNIESITVSIDNWLGVEEDLSYLTPGEDKEFTLIGEGLELSGEEIRIIASWEAGRAEIFTKIPKLEEVENKCSEKQIVDEDIKLHELDEEGLDECTEMKKSEEVVSDKKNDGNEEEGEEEIPGEEEENKMSGGEADEKSDDGESAPPK